MVAMKRRVEFLRAWDDGTWDTTVFEVSVVPRSAMTDNTWLEQQFYNHIEEREDDGRYTGLVAIAVYCVLEDNEEPSEFFETH